MESLAGGIYILIYQTRATPQTFVREFSEILRACLVCIFSFNFIDAKHLFLWQYFKLRSNTVSDFTNTCTSLTEELNTLCSMSGWTNFKTVLVAINTALVAINDVKSIPFIVFQTSSQVSIRKFQKEIPEILKNPLKKLFRYNTHKV